MTKGMRCSPKWLRRGARVIMRTLEDSRTGLISVTRRICKSVTQIGRHLRPNGVRRRRLPLAPPMTGAGVKFKALGIHRFAMKRPFAAVIICMVRCTKIVEVRPLGWRPAALNRFATACS